jgi:mannose-6-phosphate isomerase-like protein (cupin superfamily)
MRSGVVYYRREGNSLVGKWTHEDTSGRLGDEVVQNVEPGATEGAWPVEIYAPGGNLLFTGELKSTKLGDSLKLEWIGEFTEQRAEGRFSGIGIALTNDLIVASFEQVALSRTTGWHPSVEDMLAKLPGPNDERYAEAFVHHSLQTLIYAPRETDPQQPHKKDEVYAVISGHGDFVRGDEKVAFKPGDLLFVPASMPHRFEGFSDDLAVWVAFYGPEGGESQS